MKELDSQAFAVDFDAEEGGFTWTDLARQCSSSMGGNWWVGSSGVTLQRGRGKGSTFWLLAPSAVDQVRHARALVSSLTGDPEPPWSAASCARRILKWTGVTQRYIRDFDALTDGGVIWHYYHWKPGELRRAYLWDVEACYYSLLARLPSPIIFVENGELGFAPLEPTSYQRWKEALYYISPIKSVRNSMIGIMHTSGGGTCFCNGESRTVKKENGPLKAAASLIVRTAYDLCAEAVKETDAVYAATDCTINTQPTPPKTWTDVGLRVNLKAAGKAEIIHLHSYKVGKKKTEPYKEHKRSKHPVSIYLPDATLTVDPSPLSDWIRRISP